MLFISNQSLAFFRAYLDTILKALVVLYHSVLFDKNQKINSLRLSEKLHLFVLEFTFSYTLFFE